MGLRGEHISYWLQHEPALLRDVGSHGHETTLVRYNKVLGTLYSAACLGKYEPGGSGQVQACAACRGALLQPRPLFHPGPGQGSIRTPLNNRISSIYRTSKRSEQRSAPLLGTQQPTANSKRVAKHRSTERWSCSACASSRSGRPPRWQTWAQASDY
jgi:hypothetical protein